MIKVISQFETTAIVLADAGGPYTVAQGTALTLSAAHTHPRATHDWDLGDGTGASGATVTHTYPRAGFYIVKLTTVVHEEGGARTRFFAAVHCENAPPKVAAIAPITVNEGELVSMSGSFTDAGWLDTHTAEWFWGDNDAPTPGTVTEQHMAPAAEGKVAGTHAWGDAGNYTVMLCIRDQQGGLGQVRTEVTVRNLPPVVDAGAPVYAYPGTVITLQGSFTDPGWLELHTGKWDAGDGSAPATATVNEQHLPPAGTGTVVVSHIYQRLGRYHSICTVDDDRGGSTSANRTVTVVDILNAGFEEGFRGTLAGSVGNAWSSYAATLAEFAEPSRPLPASTGRFSAEEFLVCEGQRSQRIWAPASTRAGVCQSIGANPGWTYHITLRYCLLETAGGMARLGVDAGGGTDATAPGIVWSSGRDRGQWRELSVRLIAQGNAITIFLEAVGKYELTRVEALAVTEAAVSGSRRTEHAQAADACFDRVRLLPVQPFIQPAIQPPGCPSFCKPRRSS
jgi:hypothetical protein